ncbi:MAG: divalent metal cation transporter, partial [Acidobacteria bacterium]|nr:divalent metal cation transporter [Acidobacteriota bacterium]
AVEGTFSFEGMAATLSGRLGGWAGPLFALGLFAAGFSSAITAPLAAAVTVRGLSVPGLSAPGFSAPGFSGEEAAGRWGERSWRYRSVWIAVLLTGVGFGLAGVTPIPAILLAQAFNGVLLPLVAVFLMIVVNDRAVMGERGLNGPAANALMGVVVLVTLVLGASSVLRAAATALGLPPPGRGPLLAASGIAALIIATAAGRTVRRRRGAR